MTENPYLPRRAKIESIKQETTGERIIKTFAVVIEDQAYRERFQHKPGQCAMLGINGVGESMISIASSPTNKEFLNFSVMKLGKVTSAIHELEAGDLITIRGPYGNNFPLDEWYQKNIITIGGGIGQAPLRSIIQYVLDKKGEFGGLDIIYGARTTADLCYREDHFQTEQSVFWQRRNVRVHLSIDVPEAGWDRFVGVVPDNLLRLKPSPENAIAITCGPPVMIKFVIKNLLALGFKDEQIYTTLENRMKCGIGKCGRCNVGSFYVCKDGPVFSYARLKNLPEKG
ncbi:MAG: FAD/NAD(P)-binding protein [Thermodesulfobacteriota bacterium]|jgi:NAD(P)H-flavin reductase|nr:MAG: FAD/NAD(P)-binding protein [Thermodesulfobacteriota bacterium]